MKVIRPFILNSVKKAIHQLGAKHLHASSTEIGSENSDGLAKPCKSPTKVLPIRVLPL